MLDALRGDLRNMLQPTIITIKDKTRWLIRRALRRTAPLAGMRVLSRHSAAHAFPASHLAEVLAALEIDCVIDAGANEGQFARSLRENGYTGWIVSFEPVPWIFSRLRANARHDDFWQVFNFALGSENSTQRMHVLRGEKLASLHEPTEYSHRLLRDRTQRRMDIDVPVRRLDSLYPQIVCPLGASRCFLKLDTQGGDVRAFEGAGAVLDSFLGLQSEVSVLPLYEGIPDYLEALATYRAHGYEPSGFFPVLREPGSLVAAEFDCVLIRRAAGDATAGNRPDDAAVSGLQESGSR